MRKRNQQSKMCSNGEKMIRILCLPRSVWVFFAIRVVAVMSMDCVVTGNRV